MGGAVYEAVDNGEDFAFKGFNAAAEKIEKISKDNVVGKRMTQVFSGVKSFGLFEVFQRVWRTGQPEYFPAAVYKDDRDLGSWRENWVYKLPNGNIVAIFNDITDRKNIEQQFAAEHAFVQEVVNSADALIFSIDRNYRYTRFNRAHASVMKAIYGVDIQIGKSILDYMSVAVDREKAKQNIDKALAGEQLSAEAYSGDDKLSRKYFIVSHSPIRNAKGEITGAVVVSNDISERKAAEEELKMAAHIFDLVTDSICVHDLEGNIVSFNEALYKLRGYSQEEMAKMKVHDVDAPESAAILESRIKLLLEKGNAVFESVHIRKDKSLFPVEIHARIVDLEGKKLILGVARDISERRKSEETVRKSEERYRELANFLPETVFEIDLTGKITFFSQRGLETTGFTREELENDLNILSFVVPEERERAAVNMKKSMTGENLGSNEYNLSRKDGTTFPALVSTSPIISENKVTGLRGLSIDITERKKTRGY